MAKEVSKELNRPVSASEVSDLFLAPTVKADLIPKLAEIVGNNELYRGFIRGAALDRLAAMENPEAVKSLLETQTKLKQHYFAGQIALALLQDSGEGAKRERLLNPAILESLVKQYEKNASDQGFLKTLMGHFRKLTSYKLLPQERATVDKYLDRIIKRTFVIAMASSEKPVTWNQTENGDPGVLHKMALETSLELIKHFNAKDRVEQLIKEANEDRTTPKREEDVSRWRRHSPANPVHSTHAVPVS